MVLIRFRKVAGQGSISYHTGNIVRTRSPSTRRRYHSRMLHPIQIKTREHKPVDKTVRSLESSMNADQEEAGEFGREKIKFMLEISVMT